MEKTMEKPLNFKMSDRLLMGIGALSELPGIISGLDAKKVLVVTDKGLVEAGIVSKVTAVLEAAGIEFAIFDGVEPDPRVGIVYACTEAAEDTGAELLVGLGGGSSLDIAKVTAVMLENDCGIGDFFGTDNIPRPGLPTVMLPTTAGTGSEVTPIAVLSDKEAHLKKGIVSDYLYPSVALVDPALAASLPPGPTAYTGVDALTHAVEAYTNKFAQPFVDTFALAAIRLTGENLPKAVSNGNDLEARYKMAIASVYGGMCLGPVNTAAVHALAYPLGGSYDVPHGIANSLLLPYVMEFNAPANTEKFANIADALGIDTGELSPDESAKLAVMAVARLCRDVGIVSSLRELDIPETAIDGMAESAMKVTRLLNNNPREMLFEDARRIYKNAYQGTLG